MTMGWYFKLAPTSWPRLCQRIVTREAEAQDPDPRMVAKAHTPDTAVLCSQ